MADNNLSCLSGGSQGDPKMTEDEPDSHQLSTLMSAASLSSSSHQRQSSSSSQQFSFDDICLINKERNGTPTSCSSQDVGLSGSSTPLGTPLHASNENLMKEITFLDPVSDGNESCKDTISIGGRSSSNGITDGFLLDLKVIEARYEDRLTSVTEEKDALEQQIVELKEKLCRQEEEFGKTVEDIKLTFNSRLEKCIKERDTSRRDLESMVVKYAKSERDVIMCKKFKDEAEKKLRDAIKEKESLTSKVKNLTCDKTSLIKSVDSKLAECSLLQKELEKVQEELKDKDSKLKQTQQKLKFEIDDHQETCRKLGSALALIENLQNNLSSCKSETSRSSSRNESRQGAVVSEIADYQNFGKNEEPSPVPEEEVAKEDIADGDNDADESEADDNKTGEVEKALKSLKDKCIKLETENHSLTRKIQALERERLDHEEVVSKLKESLNRLNSEILDCNMKLKDMEELKVQLHREREMVESTKTELNRVTELNNELTTEMESCRHKEGELLEFTERLTAKSVGLQAEHNALEEKYSSLLEEYSSLKKQFQDLETENSRLNAILSKERGEHEKEITLMARKIAEKTELVNKFKTKVEEIENENKVMKKRHLNSIRELNKELLSMKKHMETCDNGLAVKKDNGNSDTVSNSSRSSSSSHEALSSTRTGPTIKDTDKPGPSNIGSNSVSTIATVSTKDEITSNGIPDANSIPHVDKQMLINKIFRLQKTIAKKQEKIDFLEEHNHQLLQEMKKKTKLIQYYILREESGALTTNRMDENKKQLARHGSTVMSSLYKSYPNDSAMTLSLSLEINRRLQAVLEDTILKNITLKENLNTLGEEIARLMQQKKNVPEVGASTNSISIG